jgi:hypothetical protein
VHARVIVNPAVALSDDLLAWVCVSRNAGGL